MTVHHTEKIKFISCGPFNLFRWIRDQCCPLVLQHEAALPVNIILFNFIFHMIHQKVWQPPGGDHENNLACNSQWVTGKCSEHRANKHIKNTTRRLTATISFLWFAYYSDILLQNRARRVNWFAMQDAVSLVWLLLNSALKRVQMEKVQARCQDKFLFWKSRDNSILWKTYHSF